MIFFFKFLVLSQLLSGCVVLNFYIDEDLQNSEKRHQAEPPPPVEKREYGDRQVQTTTRKSSWLLVPGWYRSHDEGSEGFELSILNNHVGAVVGIQDSKIKFIEAEYASIFTVGLGLRHGEDDKIATQLTWSAPWFFVFPYGRKIWNDPGRNYEVGMMVKIPFGDFRKKRKIRNRRPPKEKSNEPIHI